MHVLVLSVVLEEQNLKKNYFLVNLGVSGIGFPI